VLKTDWHRCAIVVTGLAYFSFESLRVNVPFKIFERFIALIGFGAPFVA
jgi:hypothetical protein